VTYNVGSTIARMSRCGHVKFGVLCMSEYVHPLLSICERDI